MTVKSNRRLFYLLHITGMTLVCIKPDVGVLVTYIIKKTAGSHTLEITKLEKNVKSVQYSCMI